MVYRNPRRQKLWSGGREEIVYTPAELAEFDGVIDAVRDVWRSQIRDYVKKHGDMGTCVLGAGIAVYWVPKGKRKIVHKMVISADDVTCAQGSITWEHSVRAMIELLAEGGLEGAFYEPGNMD